LTALRYIYRNPVEAGLCTSVEDYRWSSYRLLGENRCTINHEKLFTRIPEKELRKFVLLDSNSSIDDSEMCTHTPPLTDFEAKSIMAKISGAESIAQFQKMFRAEQERSVRKMYAQDVSIRQQVRVTGLSKGVIERMLA
jgi:hypothetical protein